MLHIFRAIAHHGLTPALEIALHRVNDLSVLSAFAASILFSLLHFGNRIVSNEQPSRMVLVWMMSIGTVAMWAGAVVILRSF
jgi:hypothetical protein